MAHSNSADILLIHNRWANENLFEAMGSLSHEQLHQRFAMGLGSLHDTMLHVLGAMRGWSDLLGDREQRERVESEGERSVDELKALHTEIADDLDQTACLGTPADIVSGERGGRTFHFTRGGVVTHVTTHGMHHRAQCMNMLRQLGVEQLPHSSVVEWMLMVDPIKAPAG